MKKRLSIAITVIVLLLIITMSTVALWKWNSSNTNVGFTISGLDAFIIYNKGTDVLAGVLDPMSSYEESAVSTEITLYKNTNKTLYGHIYLDVTTIGNTLAEESALKWAITSNGQVLNEGDFVGSSVNDSIPLKINIPLSQTEQTFKIYIWLDEGMDINDEIEGEILSTIVRAEASEVEYEVEPNSPDLVQGLIPITYSTRSCSEIVNPTYEKNPECYEIGKVAAETDDNISKLTNILVDAGFGTETQCYDIVTTIYRDGSYYFAEYDESITLEMLTMLYIESGGLLTLSNIYNFDETKEAVVIQKANKLNVNNNWYNYKEKKWANAVLVGDTNRTLYNNSAIGTEISNEDILAYYVWIPRYKYKVFNIEKIEEIDSYNAKTKGIDIVFEQGKATTGTIRCNYDFTILEGKNSEICNGNNGEYYTHPAFTFGNDELRGMWVGKYELSSLDNENIEISELKLRTKPSLKSLIGSPLTDYSYAIQKMNNTINEYGLKKDSDSHMIKNTEWGALAYLTHSKYGVCNNEVCKEVGINSYFSIMDDIQDSIEITDLDFKTGCGVQSEGSKESGIVCNSYNSQLGQFSSTTQNIYGVYDMSGGRNEYVMGNMSKEGGVYKYTQSAAGNNFIYSEATAKYIDTYSDLFLCEECMENSRLGDATNELLSWNKFSGLFADTSGSWVTRGGEINFGTNEKTGMFETLSNNGGGAEVFNFTTTRAILVSTS